MVLGNVVRVLPSIGRGGQLLLVAWLLVCGYPTRVVADPGTISGTFEVGNQGDATYHIPIVAPVATGGLKPSIALSYNHLAGNGLAGMRWNLSGISVISRCQQTYAEDGVVNGVSYDSADRFCLDGQRLVNITSTYGHTF